MLKKLLLAVMVAAPMCLFAEVKIGTVDTQEVFTLMPELKTAQASLEEVNKKYQTEYKALQDEFNKKLQEYQALAKDTPETIKQRREQELNELGQKIQTFEQVANQDQHCHQSRWRRERIHIHPRGLSGDLQKPDCQRCDSFG